MSGAEAGAEELPRSFAAAKDQGNKLFQAGDLEGAAKCYLRALGCADAGPAEQVAACGNLAQCSLQRSRPREALEWCDRALGIDPAHVKNLYRKGRALELLGELPGAQRALQRAVDVAAPAAGAVAGQEAFRAEVSRKLQEVTARLEQQRQGERRAKEEQRRAREAEVERSRPAAPPAPQVPESSRCSGPSHWEACGGYRERDWTPWLRQQLRDRCEGDPAKPTRLRVDTALGVCMTYLPASLPPELMVLPGRAPEGLKMVESGIPGVPPLPPVGKEATEFLASKIVTGEVAEWRRGSNTGVRYDLRVILWWRGVERTSLSSERHERLEGTLLLEASDEVDPSQWKLIVDKDPDERGPHGRGPNKKRQPTGETLEQMLSGARLLGERVRSTVKEMLAELDASAKKAVASIAGGSGGTAAGG